MRGQLVKTVSEIVKNDEHSVLLLGDIGVYGFRELLKNYPNRAYNIGILEQSTISLSAGLSICGLVPIVHTIAPFIVERSFEQIKVDLCYQGLGANLISVGSSYDYASLGPTHHCPGDVGILSNIPEIEIIVPGHSDEFDRLFNQNYNNEFTSYFRLSESSNNDAYKVSFGKNITVRNGSKNVIVAVGPILQSVLDAVDDIDINVIYCTTVKPFDNDSLKDFLDEKIIIVEPFYNGTLLSNISNSIKKSKSIHSIGLPTSFISKYGSKDDIDSLVGLDAMQIRKKILEIINEL